jgi:hypothetical protein
LLFAANMTAKVFPHWAGSRKLGHKIKSSYGVKPCLVIEAALRSGRVISQAKWV